MTNEFVFVTIRLWEFRDVIASGVDPHLLPLRLLVEDHPTPEMLREIRQEIRGSSLPVAEQQELLSATMILGSRLFAREVVMAVGGEEGIPVRDWPVIGEWIMEAEGKGRDDGEATEARKMALVVLGEQFGELPQEVVGRVNSADRQWCEELVRRAIRAASLQELALA